MEMHYLFVWSVPLACGSPIAGQGCWKPGRAKASPDRPSNTGFLQQVLAGAANADVPKKFPKLQKKYLLYGKTPGLTNFGVQSLVNILRTIHCLGCFQPNLCKSKTNSKSKSDKCRLWISVAMDICRHGHLSSWTSARFWNLGQTSSLFGLAKQKWVTEWQGKTMSGPGSKDVDVDVVVDFVRRPGPLHLTF